MTIEDWQFCCLQTYSGFVFSAKNQCSRSRSKIAVKPVDLKGATIVVKVCLRRHGNGGKPLGERWGTLVIWS